MMRHVNKVRGRDGVVRLYLRKAGLPTLPLKSPLPAPGEEAGSALEREVAALVASAPPPAAPSTLRSALRDYELRSADFAALAESTMYEYRLILKELEADFGALGVATFTPAYLLQLRNTWAPRGHRAANVRLQVLKNALWPAIVAGKLGDGDPFTLIPQVKRPREAPEPHPVWPDDVLLAVMEAALQSGRVGLARGVAIGRYVGARRDDIVRLTRAARRGGRIRFLSGKKRVQVDMAEPAALTTILDGTASCGMLLAYNLSGLAYTADGFALELRKLVRALHKAGKIDSPDYDVHGLRHTFGVALAMGGCTDAEGAAKMGHGSPHSFATYRRQADRIRLADAADAKLAALQEQGPNRDLQNKLQNICQTEVVKQAKPRGKTAAKSKR
jgi:integrase